MSSFDTPATGTIFMGPTPDRETTLERLYSASQRDIWNKRTEEEYLERVKARATERVRELLLQARQRGDEILREAEARAGATLAEAQEEREAAARNLEEARALRDEAAALKEAAYKEGFDAGHGEAMIQLEEERKALAETTGVVLLGIHEQCGHIFDAWRDDMAALLREAVQKATGWVVDHQRAAMLEALLEESVKALLDRRQFTVRVNPVDAELVTGMLANAHAAHWELSTDPALEPGSLVVESESALVNNSLDVRRSVVDDVLEHFALPGGPADEAAFSAVADTLVTELGKHGVELTESDADSESEAADVALPPAESGPAPVSAAMPDTPSGMPVAEQTGVADAASGEPMVAEPDTAAASPAPAPPADAAGPELSPAGAAPSSDVLPEAAEGSASAGPDAMADADGLARAEAQDMVREFLGEEPGTMIGVSGESPRGGESEREEPPSASARSSSVSSLEEGEGLPPDVADELLADLGIAPEAGPQPDKG